MSRSKAERFTIVFTKAVGMNHRRLTYVRRVATTDLARIVNKYDVQYVLKGWPMFEDGTLPVLVRG